MGRAWSRCCVLGLRLAGAAPPVTARDGVRAWWRPPRRRQVPRPRLVLYGLGVRTAAGRALARELHKSMARYDAIAAMASRRPPRPHRSRALPVRSLLLVPCRPARGERA